MNASLARVCLVSATFSLASGLFAADITLQKVPPLTVEQAPAYPENLARYHLGAQIEASPQSNPIASLQLSSNTEDRNAAEAALLCNDPTVGYLVPAGKSTVLVTLPKIENVESISFLNTGAKGNVTVSTSSAKLPADSPQWKTAHQQELNSDTIKAPIGPSEAKYVRVTFDITEPGRIAGFGVYSTPAVSDFTMPRQRKFAVQDKSDGFALISYNHTDIHAKARAVYVSSGNEVKEANHMIDDQTATAYAFSAEDKTPTAVIDLGKVCKLRRLSAVYSPRPGAVDFFVLDSLPTAQDGTVELNAAEQAAASPTSTPENLPPALKIGESAFAGMKPVGSVTDEAGRGRASVDFPEVSGRYVMVRWTRSQQGDSGFSVAEVGAFGGAGATKATTLMAANTATSGSGVTSERAAAPGEGEGTNEGLLSSDGKTMVDAKDMGSDAKDAKDMPGEGPAEEEAQAPGEGPPPSLPQPPPFTFVPQLLPQSP